MYIFGHTQVCVLCKRFILNAGIARVLLQKDRSAEILQVDPLIWRAEL
jgi:hypothetical protein